MVEGVKLFGLGRESERMLSFGHFEIVVQEKLADHRANVIHNIVPWAQVRSAGDETHHFRLAFADTDIFTKEPLWVGHQYVPLTQLGLEGRAAIAINPNLVRVESVTRLTADGTEVVKKRKWRKKYLFMVSPEQGMIINGKGLSTGQQVNIEIFWIPEGLTFEQMFPGYLNYLQEV